MPLRVKNEVVAALALLGTVSASSARIDMVALACSVGFVRGAVFCCECQAELRHVVLGQIPGTGHTFAERSK